MSRDQNDEQFTVVTYSRGTISSHCMLASILLQNFFVAIYDFRIKQVFLGFISVANFSNLII
jgi:hypothetical protein